MPLSPEDVERQTFKERFKGYDMDEVDAFLDKVVARLTELRAEHDELRRRLDEVRVTSGEEERLLQRTLITAQRTADQTVEEAQAEADRMIAAARDEAARERERLAAEAEQLGQTVAELKRFREDYLAAVRGVIEEQLATLERSTALPEVPTEIEELGHAAASAGGARPGSDEAPTGAFEEQELSRSALDSDHDQTGFLDSALGGGHGDDMSAERRAGE